MNQISMRVTIIYRWWRNGRKAIPKAHVELLQSHAMGRIVDQMRLGVSSGQLIEDIGRGAKAGIEYTGWWETRTEEEPCRKP